MGQLFRWTIPMLVVAMLAWAAPARATIVASDNASQSPYNDGWSSGDNGNTGGTNPFLPWTSVGGTGSAGVFVNDGANSQVQIGTTSGARTNNAWGMFANSGGLSQAVRPFAPGSNLQVGWDFSIAMDNGFIDSGGTVGFSLRNAAGNNLAEFFFVGGQSNYTVNASNVSGSTPGFTNQGLQLTFRLTSANSFNLSIDQLSNGVGIDNTVTGNLLTNADQAINNLRLFNANAGFNGDHDAFFNSIAISAVPEASSVVCGFMVCCLVGISYGIRFAAGRVSKSIE